MRVYLHDCAILGKPEPCPGVPPGMLMRCRGPTSVAVAIAHLPHRKLHSLWPLSSVLQAVS